MEVVIVYIGASEHIDTWAWAWHGQGRAGIGSAELCEAGVATKGKLLSLGHC